jgi:hypothetical protein
MFRPEQPQKFGSVRIIEEAVDEVEIVNHLDGEQIIIRPKTKKVKYLPAERLLKKMNKVKSRDREKNKINTKDKSAKSIKNMLMHLKL